MRVPRANKYRVLGEYINKNYAHAHAQERITKIYITENQAQIR